MKKLALAIILGSLAMGGCGNLKTAGYSGTAGEVAKYIDEEKYVAAGRLFDSYLPQNPKDAELMCQYVRYLITSYGADNYLYISSPLKTDGKYQLKDIAALAFDTAAELDENVKPALSEIVFSETYKQMKKAADKNEGFINESTWDDGPLQLMWKAIKIAPAKAKEWAPKFETLTASYVNAGRPISAMISGNLVGDLYSGATDGSDFKYATKALSDAMDVKEAEAGLLDSAIGEYIQLFQTECKTALDNSDPAYLELLNKCNGQAKLQQFISARLVPDSMVPSPSESTTYGNYTP